MLSVFLFLSLHTHPITIFNLLNWILIFESVLGVVGCLPFQGRKKRGFLQPNGFPETNSFLAKVWVRLSNFCFEADSECLLCLTVTVKSCEAIR